jgi:hypothetical protein
MSKGAKTTNKSSVPGWLQTPLQGLAGQITSAGAVDPQSRVAGSNPLLDTAQASLLGGPSQQFTDLLAKASGGGGSVGHYKTADLMKDYQDPYKDAVLKSALAKFDEGAGMTRAQEDLNISGSKGFQSSNSAIRQALTDRGLTLDRGQLASGIESDAFNTAAGLGSADANRFTQADQATVQAQEAAASRLAGLAGMVGNMDNQRTNQQFAFGDYLRNNENDRLNADWTNLGRQASLFGPLGEMFKTQTSTTKPGTMDYISSGLGAASMFFSDERLKTDIVKLGEGWGGLGIYAYRYLWSPIRYVGVMAQEVLKVKPEAVAVHPSGFLMVNYGAL